MLIWGRSPAEAKDLSSVLCHDWLWVQLSLLFSSWVEADHSPPSTAKIKDT